nr:DUF305 domain-containing protein [Streptomyces sp. IB2014 011-1]
MPFGQVMRCPAGLGRHRRGLHEQGRDWKQSLFRMMIGHHEGAIDMAKTEQAQVPPRHGQIHHHAPVRRDHRDEHAAR